MFFEVSATRRLSLSCFTIVLSCLALMVLTSPLPAQQPAGKNTQQKTHTQITLQNATKDTVRVELRIGTASYCEANTTTATQVLPPGQGWLIATTRPLCWRRLINEHRPGDGWTPWSRHVLAVGQRLQVRM